MTNPGLKRIEFYNFLGAMFDIGRKFSGKDEFLFEFRAFLEKCHRDGKRVLLIVDEAQRLSRILLEEIRLLSNIELQNEKLLNIFIVGQDELNETLDRHENRALRQRMTLIYHLEPLSKSETAEYIQHRLSIAGTEQKIFTQKAAREIYAFSGGYPRVINIICDHAMLTGYVKQRKIIHAPEIIECARDLRLKRKSDSGDSREPQKTAAGGQIVQAKPRSPRSALHYFAWIAIVLAIILLLCFVYFPLKEGNSLSGIMYYWKGQLFESDNGASTHIPLTMPPQRTFKVKNENTVAAKGFETSY
jgi:hypothetical protein